MVASVSLRSQHLHASHLPHQQLHLGKIWAPECYRIGALGWSTAVQKQIVRAERGCRVDANVRQRRP
eukprot:364697-Chlamydomonas_euryale.AAC.10